MEIWVFILSTLYYIAAASAQATAGSDPFLDESQYLLTYQELSQCSIPSSRMFARSMDGTGKQGASTFDVFCYYGGQSDNVAHFMCLYYKRIIETYFKAYCEDNSSLKKPLDESAQYKNFASNLQEVASYLATNLIAGGGQPVFQSADQCFQYCQTSEQSKEFCVNFGFVLKTALSETAAENENQPDGDTNDALKEEDQPSGDGTGTGEVDNNQADNTDETEMTHTAGEEDQQQGERIPVGGENPAETADAGGNIPEDAVNPDGKNEELSLEDDTVDETQDDGDNDIPVQVDAGDNHMQLDVGDNDIPLNVGDETPSNSTDEDLEEQAFDGQNEDGFENQLEENEESFSSLESLEVPKGTDNDADIFNFDKPSESSEYDKEKEEDKEEEDDLHHQLVVESPSDQNEHNMNMLIENERKLLEEESSSHFLAYSLTAIILVMVTYILYHNKKKIVAVIVEGRHNGQGKRRRFNQNV